MDPSDKKALSDIRLEKALETLSDARANLTEARLNTAINRSYYAALSAVRSLLILEGVDPESHAAAATNLSLRFIKNPILPVETIKYLKILYSRRTDVDYGDFEYIDAAEAEDSVRKADYTVEKIGACRTGIIAVLTQDFPKR